MDISIIGSGNIAWHLAKFFYGHGHRIKTIYNRSENHGRALADMASAQFSSTVEGLSAPDVDLLIIAVSDNALAEVIEQIKPAPRNIVVHTSGATPIDILSGFERYGVIYPPQSLNKDIDSLISEIPFAVEGSSDEIGVQLLTLMTTMAPKSFSCNSDQRLALHVGSVFANNFSNALYQMAYEILQHQGLDFELLRPIILETAKKVQNNTPKAVQTGPAFRNDDKTINRHLQFLRYNDTTREIYQQLTSFIIKNRRIS